MANNQKGPSGPFSISTLQGAIHISSTGWAVFDASGNCRVRAGDIKVGCDIHWYSETRKDGKWVCDQAETFEVEVEDYGGGPKEYPTMEDFPGSHRDYRLFGLLKNGVRVSWPISFPYEDTDLPEDISEEVKVLVNYWGEDGHSHGTLTRKQLMDKMVELKVVRTQSLLTGYSGEFSAEAQEHLFKRLTEIIGNLNQDVSPEDARLVFWFDN